MNPRSNRGVYARYKSPPTTNIWREVMPGTRELSAYDTLDDRREVYYLLARLPPRRRVEWLANACRGAVIPKTKTRPHVSAATWARADEAMRDDSLDEGLTVEVFFDFWTMAANYGLDVAAALEVLVRMARNG